MAVAFSSLTRIGSSGRFFLAVVTLASLTFAVGGVSADGAVDRGLKIGETIPPVLTAVDHTGEAKSFPDLVGERGLILLFNRSFDWWPYCKAQAVVWNRQLDKVTAQGYKVATVSYDSVTVLSLFAKRYKIRYSLLSDRGSKIIRSFGLLNESHPPGDPVHGIAHPAILVIDRSGKITGRFTEASYSRRPDINDVLDAIKR